MRVLRIAAIVVLAAHATFAVAGCLIEDEDTEAAYPATDYDAGAGGHTSFWYSGTHGGK